jgi:hypothetical protein
MATGGGSQAASFTAIWLSTCNDIFLDALVDGLFCHPLTPPANHISGVFATIIKSTIKQLRSEEG